MVKNTIIDAAPSAMSAPAIDSPCAEMRIEANLNPSDPGGNLRKRESSAESVQPIPPKMAYSTKEAARLLSISTKTLHRLRERGLVRPGRALRTLMWPHAELVRFVKEVA